MKKFVLFSFLIISTCNVWAQSGLPSTDIFIAHISLSKLQIIIDEPVNITNRIGYDNQPYFTHNGKGLLYVSIRDSIRKKGDTLRQADIYSYNIKHKTHKRITATTEDEYSPTIIPSTKCFSTVRVEKDSTQRLWGFCFKGGLPYPIIPNVKRIGYHCWYAKNKLALWILGDSLKIADATTGETQIIKGKFGRCLQPLSHKKTFSYVDKTDSLNWLIKIYSREKPVIKCLPKSEDYAWLPDGTLLMGSQNKLYKFKEGKDADWVLLKDFTGSAMPDFYRIAVTQDGDKIAFVGYVGKKP
ncbi:MAG: hypothetical protein NTX03_05470 [Bacteroidetes bacterium]|nr:hypothetical protein [Bacteroidota bacterium]